MQLVGLRLPAVVPERAAQMVLFCLFLSAPSVGAAQLQVGPGQPFSKPCAAIASAAAGDTILIDAAGNYAGDVCTWTKDSLTIRGINGRPKIDAAGMSSQGKAIWVIAGNNTVVDNIEFTGATVPDGNGAGIRIETNNITIRNSYFHHNQDGILGGGTGAGQILVEFSEFAFNGTGDGFTHNIYVIGPGTFTLRYSYSHDCNQGHLVKSRAYENHITYNRLSSEASPTSYEIDLPDGGLSYVIGNVVQQGPNDANSTFLSYMWESGNNPDHRLFVVNNTFVNAKSSGTFVNIATADPTPAVIKNNIFNGPGTIATQVSAVMANNYSGAQPNFVDPAHFDYHLQSGSAAIDAGTSPGTGALQPLDPTFEYVHPACGEMRNLAGAIDIGAYEFGGAGASLCSSPSADFSVAINPSSLNLNAGATGTYTVTVSPVNGFNGVVALSAAGLPTGATATFSPPSLTLSTGALTSTLSLSTLSSLASMSYSFTVNAASGGISHASAAGFSITTPPVGTPFLTGFALNGPPLRNNYGNFVGMKFTVGFSALTVNSLGRICVAGNSGIHTVKLVNAANGTDVAGGSLSLSMAGCTAGQFKYAALSSPITLSSNTAYYVASLEVNGGDRWYDTDGVSSTGAASVNNSVYFNGTTWVLWSGPNTSYVPANFLYTAASAPPDMTITKTHAGNFRQGQTGATYTITATNSGSSATSTTVSVIDTLPSGLTATGISGTNWTCTQPAGPCSRSDVLAGGASYPALTLTVNVAANAPASLLNTATVSGGGETNTGNDTVGDPTTIDPAGSGTAFLTGFALNGPPLRNNYGNFAGMKFTVGSSALTVNSLGRICVAGNSGTHTIKLVNAANGTDVAGGSLSLNIAGCTAGQFKYAALPSPITLPANTAYYLVTLEVNGGDRWYDLGGVSSTGAAAVNNSVYFNGATWVVWSAANTSYVPANFLYQ